MSTVLQTASVSAMPWNVALGVALTAGAMTDLLVDGVSSPVVFGAGILAAAALIARGRWPYSSALLSLTAFAIPVVLVARQLPMLGDEPTSVSLGLVWLVAVFTTGTHQDVRRAVAALSAVVALCILYAFGPGSPTDSSVNDLLAAALFSGLLPWLAAFALARQRRARTADRLVEAAAAAAAAERFRIAREVHDLVAHTITVMVVQAEAGEALLASAPDRSAESLRAVQQAGRDALAEMRRTVTALRSGAPPRHRLEALPALVDTVRSAGLPVTVVTDGMPDTLPAAVEESAYRVVQEGLTNALRHSDRSGAAVHLAYQDGGMEVSVLDTGHLVRRGFSGGHGLVGLRESVAATGGTVNAGPTERGEHLVHAVFPLP
jgi:signal transduction histidine kinase